MFHLLTSGCRVRTAQAGSCWAGRAWRELTCTTQPASSMASAEAQVTATQDGYNLCIRWAYGGALVAPTLCRPGCGVAWAMPPDVIAGRAIGCSA